MYLPAGAALAYNPHEEISEAIIEPLACVAARAPANDADGSRRSPCTSWSATALDAERIRGLGIPLVSINALTRDIPVSRLLIPHDGHPSAFTNQLLAGELKRRLLSQ